MTDDFALAHSMLRAAWHSIPLMCMLLAIGMFLLRTVVTRYWPKREWRPRR